MRPLRLLPVIYFCTVVSGSTVLLANRDLNDVFNGFETALPLETHAGTPAPAPIPTRATTRDTAPNYYPTFPFVNPLATPQPVPVVKTKENSGISAPAHTTISATNVQVDPGGYSVIGTIPPLPSITPWSANQPGSSTAQAPVITPTSTERSSAANEQVSRSVQEWKIVGVAVIAFTTVAAILLLSVFFDQWSRFLRDLFWSKKKKRYDGVEELIPDWEKASWEIRLGNDRHRYPTLPPGAVTNSNSKQDKCMFEDAKLSTSGGAPNVAGVGSGFKGDYYRTEASPTQAFQSTSPWTQGLGILTPVPPAAAQTNDRQRPQGYPVDGGLQRQNSSRLDKSRVPPSPAMSDPYCGIAD